jgi:hypothetical protein
MQITGKATISFSDTDVSSVNWSEGVPYVWITLADGMQINIPIGTVLCIANRATQIEDHQKRCWQQNHDRVKAG